MTQDPKAAEGKGSSGSSSSSHGENPCHPRQTVIRRQMPNPSYLNQVGRDVAGELPDPATLQHQKTKKPKVKAEKVHTSWSQGKGAGEGSGGTRAPGSPPHEPSRAQARSSRKQDGVSKTGGDGETSWLGKERETPANALHPSLRLSFSTVLRASEKWQPPGLPKSTLASRLLPLLGRPPPQALRGSCRPSQLPPAGQPKPRSQPRLWGGRDTWPELLGCQLC